MTRLSIGIPYYQNPGMLARQYETWAGYPDSLKADIEIVLVDDGSPTGRASEVPRPAGLPVCRLYRVLVDLPWHQHGARNLAASEAEGPWLLLTDMDHVLPATSLARLLPRLTGDDIFTFYRLDAPDLRPKLNARGERHPHVNTFAITKRRYWRVGGYDEDLTGYGTDGYFRRRLYADGPAVHLPDVPVIRYPREVVADANTQAPAGMDPKAFRDAGRLRQNAAIVADKARRQEGPNVLSFPWERVL